jgi:hypothetical protein
MAEIVIKKGSMKLTIDRNELVQVEETPDGLSFSFKNKFQLLYTDPFMPISTKSILKNTSDSYEGKKLIFDFDNQRYPVMVDADG